MCIVITGGMTTASHSVSQVVLDLLTAATRIAKEVAAVSGVDNTPTSAEPLAAVAMPPAAQTGVGVTAAGGNNTYRRYTRTGAGMLLFAIEYFSL